MKQTKQECCPEFNPQPWDGVELDWRDKKFIKGRVFTFFYMPVNFGSVISKLFTKAKEAQVTVPDNLCLSDHTSLWSMDILMAVDQEIDGMDNVSLSGKFISKVYEGDFKKTGKWMKDFEVYAKSKGYQIEKQYMWYTTCPKCAKKYGKNYVVVIGEIK